MRSCTTLRIGGRALDTLWWVDGENVVAMIDQTLLPGQLKVLKIRTAEAMARAIEIMQVRGAPAIGVSAAMGMALAAARYRGRDTAALRRLIEASASRLAATRPTAVNLFWAIRRMKEAAVAATGTTADITACLIEESKLIHREDVECNMAIGANGAALLPDGARVLTHCNAGSLATAAYGTALGVVRAAWDSGRLAHVYSDETRPRLQGSKLTMWELMADKIPCTMICDNTAATIMAKGLVDAVIVGADRIAANGDTANKIGTYPLSIVAKAHDVPVYVAAPLSTIDYSIPDGSHIVIEERSANEVRLMGKKLICPEGADALNFAFDVTPAKYIDAIITEMGVARKPFKKALAAFRGESIRTDGN